MNVVKNTTNERQAARRKRQADAGFVYVHVWIPKDKRAEHAAFVKKLNDD